MDLTATTSAFPTPLDAYPPPSADGLLATLSARIAADPFNVVATAIFVLAIVHTFFAPKFAVLAHRVPHAHDTRNRAAGRPARPNVVAELLHFVGEIEVRPPRFSGSRARRIGRSARLQA